MGNGKNKEKTENNISMLPYRHFRHCPPLRAISPSKETNQYIINMIHIAVPNFGRPNMSTCLPSLDAEAAAEAALIFDTCMQQLPVFSCYRSKSDTTCFALGSEEMMQAVTTGNLRTREGCTLYELTPLARRHYPHRDANGKQQGSQKEYDYWKGKACAFTPGALCHPEGGHKQQNMAALTGLLMYDFDHLGSYEEARALARELSRQPATFAAWVTIGGCGVRLLLRYLPDATARAVLREQGYAPEQWAKDYKTIWQHGKKTVASWTSHPIDPATCDPTRLSYLSHDPEAYFDLSPHTESNSIVIPLHVLRTPPPAHSCKAQKRSDTFTTDAHTLALRLLQKQGQAYHTGNRNNYGYLYSCLMLRLGTTAEECRQQMAQMSPALDDKEIGSIVESAAKRVESDGETGCLKQLLVPKKNAKPSKASQMQTAMEYIRKHYEMRYNIQANQVEVCPKALAGNPNPLLRPFQVVNERSRIITSIWVEINQHYGFDFAPGKIVAAMSSAAMSYLYDPIPDVLHYCLEVVEKTFADRPEKQWHTHGRYQRADGSPIAVPWSEGEDEIRRLFGAIDSDMHPDLLHWIGSCWLVGMMATALSPHGKGHIMLVLQGQGGTGKTNFFKSLTLPAAEGTDSLFAATNIGSFTNANNIREALLQLGCKMLVVLDDIPEMKAAAIDALKTWTTSDTISHRRIYDTHLSEIDRRCTLCGTTNTTQLTDDSSAERRRIVTVHVNGIAHDGMLEKLPLDLVRLYGQAAWLYRAGLQHWLTPNNPSDREKELYAYTDKFAADSVEKQLIQSCFFPPNSDTQPYGGNKPQLMSPSEVRNIIAMRHVGLSYSVTARSLSNALHDMGYPYKRSNGKRGYLLVEKPHDTNKDEAETAARECLGKEKGGTA